MFKSKLLNYQRVMFNHHLGVSIVMGVAQKWMVEFMENTNIKWMATRGTPILGNLHVWLWMVAMARLWWFRERLWPWLRIGGF